MQTILKYRGKIITEKEVSFIRQLIAENPNASRSALSKKLCLAWDWRQQNGYLKDMVCRGLMLALHRQGHINLPAPRQANVIPGANRKKPPKIELDKPLDFFQVRRTAYDNLFSGLLNEHHYLGYTQPVGEHLKYIVFAGQRPIACLAWSSPPLHIECRDRFIGWTKETRKKNLSLITYNSRFLILPWVEIPHLASHILGKMAKILPREWERLYKHRVYYLETFVDKRLFKGTSYKAANWLSLGKTSGKGENNHRARSNRTLKEVMGYPLSVEFRNRLCEERS